MDRILNRHVGGRWGIEKRELPFSGVPAKRRHYSDYYDDEMRELVQSMYDSDITKFDYTFEAQKHDEKLPK